MTRAVLAAVGCDFEGNDARAHSKREMILHVLAFSFVMVMFIMCDLVGVHWYLVVLMTRTEKTRQSKHYNAKSITMRPGGIIL
jgi:hypothetical protein